MRINFINRANTDTGTLANKKPIKVGDIISGKIISDNGSKAIIKTQEGQLVTAAFLSNKNLSEDSIIEFVITKIDEEQIFGEILNSKIPLGVQGRQISSILDEMGIRNTELNEEIVESLYKLRQPIDTDKVEYINYLFRIIESFKGDREKGLASLLLSDSDILNTPLDEIDVLLSNFNKADIENLKQFLFNDGFQDVKTKDNLANFIRDALGVPTLDQKELSNLENLLYQSHKVLDSVINTVLEDVVHLLSKNFEITPQNLYMSEKYSQEGKGFSYFLIDLIEVLKNYKHLELNQSREELIQIFEEPKDFKNDFSTKLYRVLDIMKEIESTINKENINDYKLHSSLNDLKSSIEFMKSSNENINYYQIPLLLNNQKTPIDIYIYREDKKSKKVDLSNISVLIALNLRNIGYIEALVNLVLNKINILFKTDNTTISQIIDYHSELLEDKLKEKGFNAHIKTEERKKEKVNLASFKEKFNLDSDIIYGIDVRL